MRLAGILSASTVLLLPLLLVLGASPPCHGAASHNITDILAAHPDFSEFSAALTSTGAAAAINNQGPVTVLALDNDVMARLKAQQLQPRDLRHMIYLHGLMDYFDATKLASIRDGSAQSTSLYQATGQAQSNEGMVTITVSGSGGGRRFAFALSSTTNTSNVPPQPPAAIYQKSIKEVPYDIAVLQVSAPIWSPAQVPGAPAPPPSSPGQGTAPASSPAHAPPPAPAPAAPSPAHAPPPPAPAPASSPAAKAPTPPPAIPPTPRRHPAPPQEAETPADSPDAADSEPPADQKSNGARDTAASWSLSMAMAAAVSVIWLLLW